jgi:hypothetical protein
MDVYFDSNRISLNLAMGKTFMNIQDDCNQDDVACGVFQLNTVSQKSLGINL